MTRWLVLGLSGQVGRAFRAGLRDGEAECIGLSRRAQVEAAGITWVAGELAGAWSLPDRLDAIVSLGPLDAFTRWFEQHGPSAVRVVALGSTSVHSKSGSPDPAEREIARTLGDCEQRLQAACHVRGNALTLLRPTLIYGNGQDHSLSRLVRLARRWGWMTLPTGRRGLRQPVHVDDVAAAVLGCLRSPEPIPGGFDLPGGETLPFPEMATRVLRIAAPQVRIVRLPGFLFRSGARILRVFGQGGGPGEGLLARLDQDQVYDAGPARIALGHAPRGFQPEAGMFPE